MTAETAIREATGKVPAPHDGPMTLPELRKRRDVTRKEWEETHWPRVMELEQRIANGREKIKAAKAKDGDPDKIQEAEQRIEALHTEAKAIRRQYAWPESILGNLLGLAEALSEGVQCSEGSFTSVCIPGVIDIAVLLDTGAWTPF